MIKPTDFAYHLTNFLSIYLPGQQGASANTIKSYRDTFSLLLKYYENELGIKPERITIKEINMERVESFLIFIESERSCGIGTRNSRLAAIHSFFRYLQREAPEHILSYQQILSIPTKKQPKPTVTFLSLEGIKAVLSAVDTFTIKGRRDYMLLFLMYDTGARVQEICDLTVRDVRICEPATIKLSGKGGKSRLVPLLSQTAELLKNYLDEQGLSNANALSYPLFQNKIKQKLTRAGVAYILNKYTEIAVLSTPDLVPDNISPHSFRHSKAMHLLQAGVNIVYIRDFLGHEDISTTEIYARADSKMKRKALETVSPIAADVKTPIWKADISLLSWLNTL